MTGDTRVSLLYFTYFLIISWKDVRNEEVNHRDIGEEWFIRVKYKCSGDSRELSVMELRWRASGRGYQAVKRYKVMRHADWDADEMWVSFCFEMVVRLLDTSEKSWQEWKLRAYSLSSWNNTVKKSFPRKQKHDLQITPMWNATERTSQWWGHMQTRTV